MGSNPLEDLLVALLASCRTVAAITIVAAAGGTCRTALVAATTVTEAAEEAAAFAASVAGAGGGSRAGNFFANPLAAGHGFLVRSADAHRTGGLARDLAGLAHGVLLNLLRLLACIRAHLDLLFFPFLLADRDLAFDVFGHANLLAHRHRALLVLWAVDPDLASAGGAARVVATLGSLARIAASLVAAAFAAAVAAEQAAAAAEQRFDSLALPMSQANERLLHARFLDILVGSLLDGPILVRGHVVADLAGLFLPHRDALDTADGAFLNDGNALAAERVVRFGLAFDLVRGPLGRVRFLHPFRTRD